VANDPGNVYNPLFIYGNSGLGKTHLMHAIGNAILEASPGAKVRYVTSETFTNEIINAIQNHTVKDFQEKYRTIDCLIIDDIQFLENKERTQEEFFHTFNALKEANKQIVISSDRNPQSMDKLEERLRSRFASGLTVDIQPPDLETRIAIIRKKAEIENIDMPNEVIQTVATSIDNNIRMIEGAFNRIVAYASIMHLPIDMKVTETVLKDFATRTRQNITIEKIITHICNYYNLQTEDLIGKKRPKNIALPRQIAMYLCRKMTDASLPKIGLSFGGRDHTTVIHAYEKIEKMRKEDRSFDDLLEQFEKQIRSV
jgi:chromosomal replication initiator protein